MVAVAADMTATKKRIIDAAQEEFGTYGLAGARIDRIAKDAKASKERLYAYFGDKTELFHAVLDANLRELVGRAGGALVGDDPVTFAVEVFDDTCRKPQILRMVIWGQLQGESSRMRAQAESNGKWAADLDSIRRAQDEGRVAAHWDPDVLMMLIFGVVYGWTVAPGIEESSSCTDDERARRREAVRDAVERICRP